MVTINQPPDTMRASDLIEDTPYALTDGAGNLAIIIGAVEPSHAIPGTLAVEVTFGTLYIDTDEIVAVQRSAP